VIPEAGGDDVAFQRAAESWRTNHRLLEHVNNWGWMADGEPAIAAWRRSAVARWPGTPVQPGDPPKRPDVRVGPVATGDLVVAAKVFTNWIRAANRKLVALDMEAGGAALAAYHNDQADMLIVRAYLTMPTTAKPPWTQARTPPRSRTRGAATPSGTPSSTWRSCCQALASHGGSNRPPTRPPLPSWAAWPSARRVRPSCTTTTTTIHTTPIWTRNMASITTRTGSIT
jgi:hypothetical protein